MGSLNEILKQRIIDRRGLVEGRSARGQRIQSMSKEYVCVDRQHARALAERLLDLQDHTYHCARVTVEGCKVSLDTWTPNVGITELDEEFVAEADVLYEDTRRWT